jgi:hypothetical protein
MKAVVIPTTNKIGPLLRYTLRTFKIVMIKNLTDVIKREDD